MKKIIVAIICQQPLLRTGIEHSFAEIGDIEILQSDDFQREMLDLDSTVLPDVVIVNVDDYPDNRFGIVREIKKKKPNIGIIIVSSNDDDDQIFTALKSQAAAYINIKVNTKEMVDTVRRVALGEYPINETCLKRPGVASQVIEQFQGIKKHDNELELMSQLTSREKQILDYIAQGFSNKLMARKLGIGDQTVKTHVTSIMRKLNVNSRTEAVIQAIKQNLITVS
jgi:DNA-binding NarL/FixJ family response regulator